ncbi:MAG: hypothetical protein CYPHOPRED_005976 [Cyphobasidiales sp. Tagirdzhanova-0007]|nr:MAG: hypothetical protein CYPHOPRED_005976 [Cyphobasidiales sp. Tagirdzhanova-0007]
MVQRFCAHLSVPSIAFLACQADPTINQTDVKFVCRSIFWASTVSKYAAGPSSPLLLAAMSRLALGGEQQVSEIWKRRKRARPSLSTLRTTWPNSGENLLIAHSDQEHGLITDKDPSSNISEYIGRIWENAKTTLLNDSETYGQTEINQERNSTESAQYDSLFI